MWIFTIYIFKYIYICMYIYIHVFASTFKQQVGAVEFLKMSCYKPKFHTHLQVICGRG